MMTVKSEKDVESCTTISRSNENETAATTTTTTTGPDATDNSADQLKDANNEPSTLLQLPRWRRILLLFSLFMGLFLSFLDSTIVSVALATIASQFDDYARSTWVVTAYLLTYMAFATIIARLSDIFGCKNTELASFLFFICFSLGCGLSRNMTQLIVFRALQGIGGSGLYSMGLIIALKAIPMSKIGIMSGGIGIVLVLGGVLGPILSGAITHDHRSESWRWIFYMNVPVGAIAVALMLIAWPTDKTRKELTRKAVLSVDVLGSLLLLAASILLIFALAEAGAFIYAWSSGIIITCLCMSGIAFVAFILWQEWLDKHPDWPVQLVFPIRVARQRVMGSAMLVTLLSGFVFYIAVINLPQRFQIVDQDSPTFAGVRLVPMMIASALGSFLGGGISRKKNRTSYTLIAGTTFQLLGYGLMTTLGDARPTPKKSYGFQVLMGFGFGMIMPSVTILAQLHAPPKWLSVTQGALTQMRSLGGSLGLAIGVIVFNSQLRASKALTKTLTPDEMASVLRSPLTIGQLEPQQQALVSKAYAKAFTQEMQMATYVAAVSFVLSLCTFQRHPPERVPDRKQESSSKEDPAEEAV